MRGTTAQQSNQGGCRACLLAALLWLTILSQHAQTTSTTSAINTTTTQTTSTTAPLSEICGRTNFQGKIFGGQMAKPERWPWQVSLLLFGRHVCGGVLIDKNWVVGAAHCFQRSLNPSDYLVRLGYTKISKPTKYSREMPVHKIIIHKDYNKFHRQGSDIAMMQLESPVEYSSHILPACVPDKNTKIAPNKACWASGWGHLREDVRLPLPDDLYEAELILMDNEICKRFFPKPSPDDTNSYYIYDDMVCAADYKMTKSICAGDSGGPFVCLVDGSWYVVGLTSWSLPCENPISSPSVFARVSYFHNWIKEHKKASPDQKPQKPGRPPHHPRPPYMPHPPSGGYPWINDKDQGTIIKPVLCMALLSSRALLLQLILFQDL